MKDIQLQFRDKTMTTLVGYDFGKNVFQDQIGDSVSIEGGINLIFPNHIDMLTSSFVQGFFKKWLEAEGLNNVRNNVHIQSIHPELETFVWGNLRW